MAVLALEGRGESQPFALESLGLARHDLKQDFAGLAIPDLRRIHNARAVLGGHGDAIHEDKDRQCKIDLQQRLRSGKFVDCSALIEPVKSPLAQVG